jgi:hypothetical protein
MSDQHMWRLRDAALHVLRRCGHWETLAGLRLMAADWREIKIIHRTPFQRHCYGLDPRMFTNALALARAETDLPYVLEIWCLHATPSAVWTQVLQLQWSDGEAERRVVSYRSGLWELPLMMLIAG